MPVSASARAAAKEAEELRLAIELSKKEAEEMNEPYVDLNDFGLQEDEFNWEEFQALPPPLPPPPRQLPQPQLPPKEKNNKPVKQPPIGPPPKQPQPPIGPPPKQPQAPIGPPPREKRLPGAIGLPPPPPPPQPVMPAAAEVPPSAPVGKPGWKLLLEQRGVIDAS